MRIEKYFKLNENINKSYQNVWDVGKPVLAPEFTALNAYFLRNN